LKSIVINTQKNPYLFFVAYDLLYALLYAVTTQNYDF